MAETLLLVEDNESDILFFKRALARVKPEAPLEVVTNGVAAQQFLAGEAPYEGRELPALLLLDLKLPRFSGLEILEWMRSRPELAALRTVVLTSSSEESDIRRAYALGVAAYVVKPVEFVELREVVAAIADFAAHSGEAAPAGLARYAAVLPAAS